MKAVLLYSYGDPSHLRYEETDIPRYGDDEVLVMHYSVGVRYVFVNGRPVVWDGAITDERPGRAGYQAKRR